MSTSCLIAQQSYGVLVLKAGTYDHAWRNVAAGDTLCVPSFDGGSPLAISHVIQCPCAPSAPTPGAASRGNNSDKSQVSANAAVFAAVLACAAALAASVLIARRRSGAAAMQATELSEALDEKQSKEEVDV